jgi:glycosyltransferase involved in cell wall biosynthesis
MSKRTALVALGDDPRESMPRHPTTLLVNGLTDLGWDTEWLCFHCRNAAAGRDLVTPRTRVVAPTRSRERVVSAVHHLHKGLLIGGQMLQGRSMSVARQNLVGLTVEDRTARWLVAQWQLADGARDAAFLFGDNALTRALLESDRLPRRVVFVETSDWRVRRAGLVEKLGQADAVLVPHDPTDDPSQIEVASPVLFPVPRRFGDGDLDIQPKSFDREGGAATIGFTGRLHETKGIRNLVAASQELRAAGLSVRLRIAGGSEDAPELGEWLAGQARTQPWIDYRDAISSERELVEFYRSLDCYVVASEIEGVPVSSLEALVCQVPVVATDVGGIRGSIGHLATIVAPGSIAALSAGIARVIAEGVAPTARGDIPDEREYARGLLSAAGY